MGRKKTQFSESLNNNMDAYTIYVQRLMELSMAMFEWVNLPDTIDERYLELILFKNGNAVFFKDEVVGYLALQCLNNGQFNEYNIPKRRNAYAVNGYHRQLNDKDSVIIYNNLLHTNSILMVKYYANMLWELDRTIMVNVKAQKTPVVLQGTETQKLMLTNLYMKYDGNEPYMVADKSLDIGNAIKAIRTDAPYNADRLYTLKTQIWNEALTYLGITNTNFQKKERLISDEVMRAQGGTISSRYSRLNARRQAADEINRMFGLNIEVKFRPDYREQDDEFMVSGEEGENLIKPMVLDLRTSSSVMGVKNDVSGMVKRDE